MPGFCIYANMLLNFLSYRNWAPNFSTYARHGVLCTHQLHHVHSVVVRSELFGDDRMVL